MATQRKSTILITGGNGSLGSAIALQLEKSQPKTYHFILTARSLSSADPRIHKISTSLDALGASFEFQALDLGSLESVKTLAKNLTNRIAKNEIPKFAWGGLVNSAALGTYVKDTRTKDGWNEMYGTNVLAPVLLIRELLPVLESATVVNVASMAHKGGAVDYFANQEKRNDAIAGGEEVLPLSEALQRYGSTKLLLIMAGYALQRKLSENGHKIQIVASDPGGMYGDSNLWNSSHWVLRLATLILRSLGPLVRYFRKDAINPPEVPAKAIAELFEKNADNGVTGKYFILDDEVKSSPASYDEKGQEEVWDKICKDLEINAKI